MRKTFVTVIGFFICCSLSQEVLAQGFLNRVKNKMEDKAIEKIFNEKDQTQQNAPEQMPPTETGTRNTKGGGLVVEPPNVIENINTAQTAFKASKYSESRFAIRQAILGVEMEIGKSVLESLPSSIDGLDKDASSDRVTSTGIGFVGMTIERQYMKGDRELKVMIANNSALLSAVSMYMASGAYGASTDQNFKHTTFQGNKAVIEFDENTGYKLNVPFGQSSIFVLEGVNFETEQQMMAAAEKFDLEKIKKTLGEQ